MPPLELSMMQHIAESRYNTGGATYYPTSPSGGGSGYVEGSYAREATQSSSTASATSGVAQQGTRPPRTDTTTSSTSQATAQPLTGKWSSRARGEFSGRLPSAISNPAEALFQNIAATNQPAPPPPGPSNTSYAMEQYLDSMRLSMLRSLCTDIARAHESWRKAAYLQGVSIQGPVATGGTAVGPDLGSLLRAIPHPATTPYPFYDRFRNAVATGMSTAWRRFEGSITVPGLNWYPTFAQLPGPFAPPTPNTPSPLSALTSGSVLTDAQIASEMKGMFGTPVEYSNRILEALAYAFVKTALFWISRQSVTNVLGTGPVMRPPYASVGPVIGGTVVPNPGVFWEPPPGTGGIIPTFQ